MTEIKADVKTNNLTKDDYAELEGKIIQYNTGGHIRPVVVLGCNRSIGCTIVDVKDKNKAVVCFAGPLLERHKRFDNFVDHPDMYEEYFTTLVRMIKNGYIDGSTLSAIYDSVGITTVVCSTGNCAFRM